MFCPNSILTPAYPDIEELVTSPLIILATLKEPLIVNNDGFTKFSTPKLIG